MKVINKAVELNQVLGKLKASGRRIGLVPTMGALHEGHLSLVRRARKENDIVVVSIFVNPTQFGPKEDFKKYPRNFRKDQNLLIKEKVDFLFFPSVSEIYPKGFNQFIEPGPLEKHLCGLRRPGHFRGVATVVNRLFDIVKPNTAYFGEKDFQQVRVIEEMVRRFSIPVKIKPCPIVREPDGLAMSSRNKYLSKRERVCALALFQSLKLAKKLVFKGERSVVKIKKPMVDLLKGRGTKIDYVEIVNPKNLNRLKRIDKNLLIAIACFVGKTRLIDNLLIQR